MSTSNIHAPRKYTTGYGLRKGFAIFFQVYSFLWICFFVTCLVALIWSVATCSATYDGSKVIVTFGSLPTAMSFFMPINIGWSSGAFTYSLNAMTYLNIVLLALELIFVISEIILVCSFKSPRKVSEKSIKIIQSSLAQKPHKIVVKKLS